MRENSRAKETELYISLDYPPAEKYREGYAKVEEYLAAGIEGFREVHIFKQKENLGAIGNSDFLRGETYKKYDRYIYSEDDNVFAKNFLEYMNLNLEKYAEDKNIHTICGCSFPIDWSEKADCCILTSDLTNAYGYGSWKDKQERFYNLSKTDIQNFLLDKKKAAAFRKRNPFLFNEAVYIALGKHYCASDEKGDLVYIDIVDGIYMQMLNRYAVVPTISKVRNEGYDASGLHCDEAGSKNKKANHGQGYTTMQIDSADNFDASNHEWKMISQEDRVKLNHMMYISGKQKIKSLILLQQLKHRMRKAKNK